MSYAEEPEFKFDNNNEAGFRPTLGAGFGNDDHEMSSHYGANNQFFSRKTDNNTLIGAGMDIREEEAIRNMQNLQVEQDRGLN